MAVQEPRCSGTRAIATIKKLGFKYHIISDARGFAGGIWILWNSDDVHLSPLVLHEQFIHVEVKVKDEAPWFLSAIYASLRESSRS